MAIVNSHLIIKISYPNAISFTQKYATITLKIISSAVYNSQVGIASRTKS